MSDDNQQSTSTGNEPGQQSTDASQDQTPTIESLTAEVDKWKALSRTNEQRWKDASSERDALKQAGMSDAEKAIEAAKAEARNAALSEVGTRLAEAELRALAASAGVDLPPADFLNMSRFVGNDGQVNADALSQFVSSLPKRDAPPAFRQDIGLGRQGSPGANQLTRADLSNMTPAEINKARQEGRLDALLRGEI
ncbi:hypothetical protein ACFVYF_18785 [Streptomyces sp. NPDC058274]|uniref:hypothetical protein n=1 Tax=Streptomyces sp. NPDC058274 TaxID=3346416 RepID=UPI0036EBDD3A